MDNSQKILSVCVASYNVEKYLSKTLDSCMVSGVLDKLEIIIVNDGSTDRTEEIAGRYVQTAPDSFRLISKANGGYGSAVNAALSVATGKYFRLLDGDDWFDSEGLAAFIGVLEQADEDMIVTRFRRVFASDGHTEERDEGENIPFVTGTFDELPDGAWFTMHAVTYRTSLLQENRISITERCYYTDQEYDLLPLRWVETLRIVPLTLYCYRIGHGGQSVSVAGLEKHYREQTAVLKKLYSVYSDAHEMRTKKNRYIYRYFVKRTRFHIRTFLVISRSREHRRELREFMEYLKEKQPDIYRDLLRQSRFVKLLVWSRYALYGVLHYVMLKKYRY
ncbi:MAG: glycosyltransferase family 2 protein [Clostridia bacterium]|nr:glycosyltransferase family 2 protein [Clostridia bacterium]